MTTTSTPLRIGLPGIARLADVKRPVVSVWRTRFAQAEDAFPPPVEQRGGHPVFDAQQVATWLTRTGHGNNPDAAVEIAAAASPPDFDFANAEHVDQIDAVIALRASSSALAGLDPNAIVALAENVDPSDESLQAEIRRHAERAHLWTSWADELTDAAWSPEIASAIILQRHSTTAATLGSRGPLSETAEALLTEVAVALLPSPDARLHIEAGIDASLAFAVADAAGDEIQLSTAEDARHIRRRMLCARALLPTLISIGGPSSLSITRLPSATIRDTHDMLRELDEIVLSLRDFDRGLCLAPARLLTDALDHRGEQLRAQVLRSGRIRGIVRLSTGLVTSAPREALALWVLGREYGEVPPSDRFTAVADLTDHPLTQAARADLASDLVAAMGTARELRAHAFRFTRIVRTTSLIAAQGALIDQSSAKSRSHRRATDLPALLDASAAALGAAAPHASLDPVGDASQASEPARIDKLLTEGHLRVISGTRLDENLVTDTGLAIVTANALDTPDTIGAERVSALRLAQQHPSAQLTSPGDIIFRTSPTPRAWVDREGSKVVVYPARVLRITAADPGGLVPELIAADIAQAAGGPGAWKRWMLRRVTPAQIAPLRTALIEIADHQQALRQRLTMLDTHADLLADAVASGAVTITSHLDSIQN
ncbi:hypothetical protein [Microbacterium sp. R86528]|uniref:hypothetical protein n=1 Tax=Microbacterium sp. R86528 TaxID=3093864 RepID=UPI0037C8A1BF